MSEKRFQVDWKSVNNTLNRALANMIEMIEEDDNDE